MRSSRRQHPATISAPVKLCACVLAAAALSACSASPRKADDKPATVSGEAEAQPAPPSATSAGASNDTSAPTSATQPQASGYEPPMPVDTTPPGETPTPQTHAATPAPDLEEKSMPPSGLPEKADTPGAPQQVFSTDVRGVTTPDSVVPKDAVGPNNKPMTPTRLCDQNAPSDEEAIDMTRRRVEEMVCAASMWFDGLFGDSYYVGPSRKVYGRIELSENYSQFYGNKVRLRFDARVDLPNINKHLSAFIGRGDEEDFITDRFDNSTLRNNFPQVNDEDQVFAGLGYALPSNRAVQTSFRVGVRGLAHPEAFAQGRFRYNAWSDDKNLIHLRATPFWTTADHLGVTLGADYSHVVNNDVLFRWGNIATDSASTQGWDWRVTWTLYQAVRSIKSGFAYELFVRGETEDDVPLHEYGFQTTFRHPLFKQRLYAEWVAGYSFPREDLSDDRKGSFLVGAGLQMPFGQRE